MTKTTNAIGGSPETVRHIWGLACPKCGRDDRLQIKLTTMADLMPSGTEPTGDQLWDETSYTRCGSCGHDGKLASFYAEEVRS